eukprot:15365362-Ditylum_brightwellii.AAC.1
MNSLHNLKYDSLVHEFRKTKCKLHSHSGGITDKEADTVKNKIGVVISDLAHQIVAVVDALDEYTSSVYLADEHETTFGCSPMLYCDYKALEKREKFCNLTKGRKIPFKEYQTSIAAADGSAGGKVSHLLETNW